ncbi:MAG: hypothetical protein ACI3ZL_00260 [Candidatus Cryptobacteroides sp.]
MRIRHLLAILAIISGTVISTSAKETIRVRERGIVPDTGEDMAPALDRLISSLDHPAELVFEAGGTYRITAAGTSSFHLGYPVAVGVSGKDSLSFQGNGCTFIGEGKMYMFRFEDCRNVSISGITFDFDEPLASMGTICGQGDGYLDIRFDAIPEFEVPVESFSTLHDPKTKEILQGTKDKYLSPDNALFRGRKEILDPHTVRYYGECRDNAPIGSLITLYQGLYMGGLFSLQHCDGFHFSKLVFHHSGGFGIRGDMVGDISIDSLVVSPSHGRSFSLLADALHFNQCRGKIAVRDSYFDSQGDDALNVHGRYIRIAGISCDRKRASVRKFTEIQDLPMKGDSMWMIVPGGMERRDILLVEDTGISEDEGWIRFAEPLPEYVEEGYFMENASWIASLEVRGCTFGRGNRARGILFTTPGKVEICDNIFRSSGSAILIEGDTSYWFESGAVTDADIHDNIFDNCGTSCMDSLDRWGWGLAPICITPSAVRDTAPYHRNIRIHDNRFIHFDNALMFAHNVDNLVFIDNELDQSSDYKAILSQRDRFVTIDCSNVILQ